MRVLFFAIRATGYDCWLSVFHYTVYFIYSTPVIATVDGLPMPSSLTYVYVHSSNLFFYTGEGSEVQTV